MERKIRVKLTINDNCGKACKYFDNMFDVPFCSIFFYILHEEEQCKPCKEAIRRRRRSKNEI